MGIEENKFRRRVRSFALRPLFLRPVLALLILALTFVARTAAIRAADNAPARKVVFVTLNAGETYVISNVSGGATPAVHVLHNPHALIVNSGKPGEVVLVGTEAGQWAIDVTTADGQALRYKVSVNAIANPFSDPLAPGKNPPALGSPHFGSAADQPVRVAALDPSAGLPPLSPSSPAPSAAGPLLSAGTLTASGASHPAVTSSSVVASSGVLPPATTTGSASTTPPTLAAGPSAPFSPSIPGTGVAPATTPAPPAPVSPMFQTQSQPGQIEQFRTNPPAIPRSPSLSGPRSPSLPGPANSLPADVIEIASGSSHIIDFTHRIRRISIADSTIADVQVITPFQINLVGHKEGFTTLAVWDPRGHYEERQIRIDAYGTQQVMLNVIVAELDRSRLEQQGINWAMSLPNQGVSFFGLPGQVATPYNPTVNLTASQVLGAGSPTQTLVNQTPAGTLPAAGALIPLLLSSTLNYGIAAGNSNFQTQFLFQSLENHNFAKILAEPRLLANSGEKAEFLSGGEIPIVVAQALNTSIVFKKFGTSVIFVPTVIGSDVIQLQVKPEVSQPDYAHAVQLYGFSVPAFVTRTAETSVRLRNDQTLIIAGLILHTKTSQLQKTPYLGDIPYIGALFRTTSFQDQENDLVMTVTPEIIKPIPVNGIAAYPTDRGPLSPSDTATKPLYPQDVSRPRF